jgi:hypothetical protein
MKDMSKRNEKAKRVAIDMVIDRQMNRGGCLIIKLDTMHKMVGGTVVERIITKALFIYLGLRLFIVLYVQKSCHSYFLVFAAVFSYCSRYLSYPLVV